MTQILKDMREKQAVLVTNARSKFDEIDNNTDESRAAEIESEYDAIMADHDKLESKIERELKLADIEARLNKADDRRPSGDNVQSRGQDQGQSIDYRHAFHEYLKSGGQTGNMSEEARSVLASGQEARAQSTTSAAGGYTIPTELHSEVIKSMLAWGPMYNDDICTVINTTGGGAITIPTVNDTAKVVVQHVQGTALTNDGGADVVFGEKTLNAHAYNTEFLNISKELLDDSVIAVESFIGSLLGERLGRRANLELTTGDGTGDPNGVVTASTSGKVAGTKSWICNILLILLIVCHQKLALCLTMQHLLLFVNLKTEMATTYGKWVM